MSEVYPYILPLPADPSKQHQILVSIFGSEVALEILKRVDPHQRTYQRDLIEKLNQYSNKTVITYLKTLVSMGLLEEGMEKVWTGRRYAWRKWYKPTFLGKWFVLLLQPPGSLPKSDIEAVVKELFALYLRNLRKFCERHGIGEELIKSLLDEALKSE